LCGVAFIKREIGVGARARLSQRDKSHVSRQLLAILYAAHYKLCAAAA
jgi:hypothetical protein